MQAGGKQLCGKGPGALAEGRALVTEEAKQQHPGLYHQVPSQWVEEGGCPLQQLGAMCMAPSFRPPIQGSYGCTGGVSAEVSVRGGEAEGIKLLLPGEVDC